MKYTVLMYNFNGYEVLREPKEVDPECEYLYITDNPNLKSEKWKIIIDSELEGMSPFDKCYAVRFNLFKYATTPICIYVDGSIQIHKSLKPLYEAFVDSDCDIGLNIHPDRDNMIDEYMQWIKTRNYDRVQAIKAMHLFEAEGYDPYFRGLYQGTMRICKNTVLNKDIDENTISILKMLGNKEKIERLDQTIYSFVVNKYFRDIKIFGFSQEVFQSSYMTWCKHNSFEPLPFNPRNNRDGYIVGKLSKLYHIE